MSDKNSHKDELEKNGYTIIKNVYSDNEINFLRNGFIQHFDNGGGFIVSTLKTRLKKIIYNLKFFFKKKNFIKRKARVDVDWYKDLSLNNLKEIATSKLNEHILSDLIGEDIIFAERNDFHINTNAEWHKDILNRGARKFQIDNPWSIEGINNSKIYAAITYLQTIPNGEGLMIKKYSHLTNDVDFGEDYLISNEVELGDTIIFDIRLTHKPIFSGNYDRVFFSTGYGIKSKYLDQYIEGTLYRQKTQRDSEKLHY